MTTQTLDTAEPETLRFGYGDTALGTIVVAESMHGIAALFIGDDRAKLLSDLEDAFPEAEFVLDQTGLAQTIAKVIALVDAPHIGTDLTLDLRGSPVEVSIWNALQAIPAGETSTYGAIAQSLPITVTAQEVGAAADEAGQRADRHADPDHDELCAEADQHRHARAIDQAREQIAPDVVGAERVIARRSLVQAPEVRLGVRVGREHVGEDRDQHENDDHDAARHRELVAQEPPPRVSPERGAGARLRAGAAIPRRGCIRWGWRRRRLQSGEGRTSLPAYACWATHSN